MRKITVPIRGMHCRSCELLIEERLKSVPGVIKADADYGAGKVDLYFGKKLPGSAAIVEAIKDAGYDVGAKDKLEWVSRDKNDYLNLAKGALALIVVFFLAEWAGLFRLGVNTEKTSFFVIFMVGLVAGVSTCMALVGGLVLSISARHAEAHPEISAIQKFRPHLYFNLGRVLGFGFLGGILAVLGKAVQPSTSTLGVMTMAIGAVMIFLGLKLVEIFPVLKDKSISLPKSVSKFFGLKREQKEYSHLGSFATGALTFFLPCGFTQAMQLYAVSSGSFVNGALTMSLFALGTAPGLLGIGGLASVFKGKNARIFFAATGLAVIFLGWVNVSNGSTLAFQGRASGDVSGVSDSAGVQEVRMTQNNTGYFPNKFTVEKGKKVRWVITSTSQFSCASSLVMPEYGISRYLTKGENVIEFVPTETGEAPFSCAMGMYRGKFVVVNPGEKSVEAPGACKVSVEDEPSVSASGSADSSAKGTNGSEQVIKAEYTRAKDISPKTFEVKRGVPVRFEIDAKENGSGCMGYVMIPGICNDTQYLEGGKKIVLSFTPQTAGDYRITCSMGSPRGIIRVVN